MASIDVTGVLASLNIANQQFSVVQRSETLDHGRSVISNVVVPNLRGAVQPLGDNSLLREEQYSTSNNGITVWTKFRLNAVSVTIAGVKRQPDLILWGGAYYEVKILDDWTDFGPGYTKAECIMINYVPPANE